MEALLLENKTNCAQPEQLFSSGFRVMLWTTPTAGEGGQVVLSHTAHAIQQKAMSAQKPV